MTTRRSRIALLSSLMGTVFLAACGGGDESNAADASNMGAESSLETAAAISPTSSGTWTKIANEWSYFTLSSSQYVRYGSGSKWVGKYVSGKAQCANDFFGSDPA
ncbi:hypothetical protein HHL10_28175, partial [Azohydromonas sp. G-1-1-14]|nr:hypothetical protein [Azohydromonas caseinilytica]